jgi:hypothetical protein
MLRHLTRLVSVAILVVLSGWPPPSGFAQDQAFTREIEARARVFPEVGPGVSALKRDAAGRYYILAAPANTVLIYGGDGKRIGQIPNAQSHGARIVYASDIDVDVDGRLFIADRGANAVQIFSADGSLLATVHVTTPMSIAALSGLEFAATLLRSDHLLSVFSAQGTLVRAFGEEPRATANPQLSPGHVYGDGRSQIYFVFTDLPDPTIRKYDRFGQWHKKVPGNA